jgi:hypothetical protein
MLMQHNLCPRNAMAYGKITSNRQWGRALWAFAVALVLLAMAMGWNHLMDNPPEGVTPGPLPLYILLFIFFGQSFTVVRCLKRRSADAFSDADLDDDKRAPILYLRPFAQDSAVLSSGPRIFNILNPFSWGKVMRWRGLLSSWSAFWRFKWTFEQLLQDRTHHLGPLVAIGQPGAAPILGAHNLFVGEDWQNRVADLSRRAQLVVLAAGDTPGILWEVNFMLKNLDPTKCLIYVENGRYRAWWPVWRKGGRRKLWRQFRALSREVFPVPLPEQIGRSSFVGFDAGWVPRLVDPPRKPPEVEARDRLAYHLTQLM